MMGENAGLYRPGVIMWLMIFLIVHSTHSAPVYDDDTTHIAEYEGAPGCYYNFQYYEEGDRIMTNEPCLNCTCHNRMLMCYLRVCPQFTKAIGQNCQVEKRPDQCCPVITCPEVPVQLLTSTTSAPSLSSSSGSTEVGFHDNYGCSINNKFYADGAQLPTDPNNPCELCYCIRNRTTCTMQQCTLKIAGCNPVYHPGICCPVKYDCDYDEESATTPGTTPGLIMTTTMLPGIAPPKCSYGGKIFNDGDLLYSTEPCHHCYCFRGDIACAIEECGKPMESHGKNCTALPPPDGTCCPTTYECDNESESVEGEEQQKVTQDENEIVATQATLPIEKTDEEKQKHEEVFLGADNAIPEDHQVHEEITLSSVETAPTTEAATIEVELPKSTTSTESNEVPMKEISSSVPEENAVPQGPVEPVTHVDEATQSTDGFKPTEATESIESNLHEKLTTIIEEVESTKSPSEEELSEKPEEKEKTETHTETSITPSEKPSTSLPARSEDQFPVEQPIEEISTNLSTIENESSETPVTVSVTTEAEIQKETNDKPTTTIPESNEIPKVKEEPKVEATVVPEEATTISEHGETTEKKHEDAQTMPSLLETPDTSNESKPVSELPKTELPEEEEEKEKEATVHSTAIPDVTDAILEYDSTSGEEKHDELATTPSTISVHDEFVTETIVSELTEIPMEGPPGIPVSTRGPVTKAEDNESVTELVKPELPVEVSSETAVTEEKKIDEKPDVPAEQTTAPIAEAATVEPEKHTPGEHIQSIPEAPEVTQTTELPIVHDDQSTVMIEIEKTPAPQSTEMSEDEMPTKGLEVSGEQSSEEATSSKVPTSAEKQSDSAESSSEEESDESSSSSPPMEYPSSTESSSKPGSELVAEGQVTEGPEEEETVVPGEQSQPPKSDEGKTELPNEEPETVSTLDELFTPTLLEFSSTSASVEMEHTEGTKTVPEVTEVPVTSIPQDLSTKSTEESENQTTAHSIVQEHSTEKKELDEPVTMVIPEESPVETVEPTEKLGPVSEQTESSIAEQPMTESVTLSEGEKVQTEQPIILEDDKSTDAKGTEEKTTEASLKTSTILPDKENETASPTVDEQTEETTLQPAVSKDESTQKETPEEDEVQQTQTPIGVSEESSEAAVTTEKLVESSVSIESKVPEEKLSDEPSSTPAHETVEKSTETAMTGQTNELPDETKLPHEEPGTESTEKAEEASLFTEKQEKATESSSVEKEVQSITTESSIAKEKSTEKSIESETPLSSVSEQQPTETPMHITEISSEISTTEGSDVPITHTEEKPVEPMGDETIASVPAGEQTPKSTSEIVTEPTVVAETEKIADETPEQSTESATEPSIISEGSTASSEESKETLSTVTSIDSLVSSEHTILSTEQSTDEPKYEKEEKPIEEELSSSVTPSSTSAIEKETVSSILTETKPPVKEEPIATDVPVVELSDSSTELPSDEEKPDVTPKLTPSIDETPALPAESSTEIVESTEKIIEEEPSSTEHLEEMSPTTSSEFEAPGIPGEGNCLIDGESFTNNSVIPPVNPCQISCHCISSIVQCELVKCPPPPSHLTDCMPVHVGVESCCPMYTCHGGPTPALEADNQMAEHSTPESESHEEVTEVSSTIKIPVEESQKPEEPTKQSEDEVTPSGVTEGSTSAADTEGSSTREPAITIATEELSDITPEKSNVSSDHTETPEVILKDITSEIDTSPTSSPMEEIETTQTSEPSDHSIPSLDNRVSESENVTTVTEKTIEVEPTSVEGVPEGEHEEEAVTVITSQEHSTASEEAQTEGEMISTEGIKESTPTNQVHDEVSSSTGESSEVQPSTEAPEIPASTEKDSTVSGEVTIAIAPESPVEEEKPAEESSEEPQQEPTSSEHSIELTPTSTSESLSEHLPVEPTDAPLPGAGTNETDSNVSPSVEEQTQEPIAPEIQTSTVQEPDVKSTEIIPTENETEISAVTEEQKEIFHEPTEISEEELTTIKSVQEETATSEIPEKSPTAEKQPTSNIIPEISTQSSIITEESSEKSTESPDKQPTSDIIPEISTQSSIITEESSEKSTESPDKQPTSDMIPEISTQSSIITEESSVKSTESSSPADIPTEPLLIEETSATSEPIIPSETSSLSITPEIPEDTESSVIEFNTTEAHEEQTPKSISNESTEIPSSESEGPASASITKSDSEITETPTPGGIKSEEEHTSSSAISTESETAKSPEEPPQQTTSSTSEASISETQSVKDATEKPLDHTTGPTTIEPVESEIVTEQSPAATPEEATEEVNTVTKSSVPEAPVTEILNTTEKVVSPSTDEEVTSEVADEKPEDQTKSSVEEEQLSTSASPESSPTPESPAEELPLSTVAPVEAITEISEEEKSTETIKESTETPMTLSASPETSETTSVSDEKLTEAPIEEEKTVTTAIKSSVTSQPAIEEATTLQTLQEKEPVETIAPEKHTPTTSSPAIVESSTNLEESSPTTAAADEKPTEITEKEPEEPAEIPTPESPTLKNVTLPNLEETTTHLSTKSPVESTESAIIPEVSDETPVIISTPSEPEIPIVEQQSSTELPSESSEDDQEHQIVESPMIPEQHEDIEGQQTISPIAPEIVQEHVTELNINSTSPHHGYIPPSSTESPSGGEYPEESVSGEDNPHFPVNSGTHLNPDEDYDEDDQAVYGPGTCRYSGKVYVSAQQIPRDDPCDFCFCFRSDIICLQQSCPPPIPGCHEEPIGGFCCPRYECPVSMATSLNITTTTTTTTTTLPPHFLSHAYKGAARRSGCQIKGRAYKVGEVIQSASGPCLHCTCGGDGNMKCDPRVCTPEPMIRQMIAAATAKRRR